MSKKKETFNRNFENELGQDWCEAIEVCLKKSKGIRCFNREDYQLADSMKDLLKKYCQNKVSCWDVLNISVQIKLPKKPRYPLKPMMPEFLDEHQIRRKASSELALPEYVTFKGKEPKVTDAKYQYKHDAFFWITGVCAFSFFQILLEINIIFSLMCGFGGAWILALIIQDRKNMRCFRKEHAAWKTKSEDVYKKNQKLRQENEEKLEQLIKTIHDHDRAMRNYYDQELKKWQAQCVFFDKEYNKQCKNVTENAKKLDDKSKEIILSFKNKYKNNIDIVGYASLLLAGLIIPITFPHLYRIDYFEDSQMLIIDYMLPSQKVIPNLKEKRFLKTKNEMRPIYLSKSNYNALYDDVVYQLLFIVLDAIYSSSLKDKLSSINLNGWVSGINKATGKVNTICIASINVPQTKFAEIDLAHIDAKAAFKYLKGIGSTKLCEMVAIKPIIRINKSDRRFIESYDVAYTLDDSVNIAAMNWEDFEHLVREVFQKKLSSSGIEVKVTQSSRDKGVDAVAFNPDLITGGKIIIQAKRYTNVVGVSAVRDLYGTIVNEGATKGILVTTSNYGKDAYEFAKDKPITLLSGAEFLSLLEECGHKARINLQEAKDFLKSQEK